MLKRTYELDMVPGGIPLSIHLSQYDSDVLLVFRLYASQGTLMIPESGVVAQIRGTKLDGNGISADCTLEIVDSVPVVSVQVTKQMTAIAGKNTFEIVLKAIGVTTEYDLPSANFYLEVERAALDYDTLESKSEIKEIEEILSDADGIIEALHVSKETQEKMAALTERAETAATSAEKSAEEVASAKEETIAAKDAALQAVTGFNDTVNSATNAVIESLQNEAAIQVGNIQTAGDGVKEYVDGVVNIAKQDITSSKNAAVESVENAGSTAVGDVNAAKNAAMETISNAAEEINNIKTQADTTAALALQQANAAMNEVAAVENTVNDVKSGFDAMEAILGTKVDGGYVENDSLYLTSNGEVVAGPFTGFGGSGTGGGGGGSTNSAVLTVTNATGWVSSTIASGATCVLSIEWSSIEDGLSTGNGSLTIKVGGVVKAILDIAQGLVSTDVGEYLAAGNNSIQFQVMDSYGNSRVKNFTVTVVELSLASSFDDSTVQSGILAFPYTPYGTVSKTVHFVLDGVEQETVTTSITGRQQTYIIPAQSHGAHTLQVYFEAVINGNTVRSNELFYEIIWTQTLNQTPVIGSSFNATDVVQYATVTIPYLVYSPSSQMSDVIIKVGERVVSEITVDRSKQVFSYRVNNAGEVVVTISTGEVEKRIVLNVEAAQIDVAAETENLALYLSSASRSNNEANPAVWTYGDISAEFSGFNWASDGWQMDEDGITALRLFGDARLTIPYKPFAQDFRTTGKTIEIEFAARDVLNYDTVILSCLNGGRGISLTAQMCMLTSEQSSISMQFKEEEHVRVGFVVEKRSGFRRIYCYINGVMSGVVQYPADDDFSQVIPADITIGSNQCTMDLYCIRVYDNDLTSKQMEDNWIADTQDGGLLLERYNRNNIRDAYGNVVIEKLPSDLPYMILECAELPQFKGDKKTVSGSYTDPLFPSKSFTFSSAQADVQGTSSQYYERKNYKLKFPEGIVDSNGKVQDSYKLRDDSIATNVFCMKADVASSEGANNVELVRLYNDACPYKTPAQVKNEKVRQGIDGFPIVIFWRNTGNDSLSFLGKYNFNNDKSTSEVFGFVDGDESWEVLNNTSDRVLFKSDDFYGTDWLNDFEARYPDTKPPYTDSAQLAEFSSWMVSVDPEKATGDALPEAVTIVDGEKSTTYTNDTAAYRKAKFRAELGGYVELDSALFYYLFTELFLMVDSRAKNMFPSFIGTDIS